jgi:hypothetical protein
MDVHASALYFHAIRFLYLQGTKFKDMKHHNLIRSIGTTVGLTLHNQCFKSTLRAWIVSVSTPVEELDKISGTTMNAFEYNATDTNSSFDECMTTLTAEKYEVKIKAMREHIANSDAVIMTLKEMMEAATDDDVTSTDDISIVSDIHDLVKM